MGDAKALILVNSATNMPIAMQAHIANKKIHGHSPRSATRLTQTSSNAQIHISVAPLPTVGLCLKKIEERMCRSACHYIHRKKVPQWDGGLPIPLQILLLMISRLMECIASQVLLFLLVILQAIAQLLTILYTIDKEYNSLINVTQQGNQLDAS